MDGGVALIIGSVISGIGQLQAGANAQRTANTNAKGLFDAANSRRLVAIENAKREKRLGLKRQGANRALDPDKLDLLEDNAIEEELGIQTIIHAGEVEAIGFENQGRLQIARGSQARKQAIFGAFSTVLMGVGMSGVKFPGSTLTPGSVGSPLSFGPSVVPGTGAGTGNPLQFGV